MDTLTLLLQILGALVECAKIVTVVVALALFGVFCKYIPLKLRKFLPRLAATAFIFTLAEANFENSFILLSLCWNRLGSIMLALYGSVSMMLILFTVILVTAMVGISLNYTNPDIEKRAFIEAKRSAPSISGKLSNSFLSTTPVLIS